MILLVGKSIGIVRKKINIKLVKLCGFKYG